MRTLICDTINCRNGIETKGEIPMGWSIINLKVSCLECRLRRLEIAVSTGESK